MWRATNSISISLLVMHHPCIKWVSWFWCLQLLNVNRYWMYEGVSCVFIIYIINSLLAHNNIRLVTWIFPEIKFIPYFSSFHISTIYIMLCGVGKIRSLAFYISQICRQMFRRPRLNLTCIRRFKWDSWNNFSNNFFRHFFTIRSTCA